MSNDMIAKTMYEVGDSVFCSSRMRGLSKLTVIKTGKLHATLCNGVKIRITGVSGCTAAGSGIWPDSFYYLSNPDLEEKYERQQAFIAFRAAVDSINTETLTTEQLKSLTRAIKNATT